MVIAPEKVKEKAKESVVKTMEQQLSFFLREYTISKRFGLSGLYYKDNERALKKMQGSLEKLKRFCR